MLSALQGFNLIQWPYNGGLLSFAVGIFGTYLLRFKNNGDDDDDSDNSDDESVN